MSDRVMTGSVMGAFTQQKERIRAGDNGTVEGAPISALDGILSRINNANQWLSENIAGLDGIATRCGFYAPPENAAEGVDRLRNDGLIDNIDKSLDVLDRLIGTVSELRSRLNRLA